ncbi:MAG: hypothetical protein M3217_06530 [Actinomycetota bacterium]|nr:hypothetical protein [Actinomycetota bacterium]
MRKLVTGLIAALLAVAGAACGDGGDERDLSNALLTAAEAADDAGTVRMEMTSEVSVGGQSVTVDAEGEFDVADDLGRMTVSASGAAGVPGIGEMEVILDGRYMYVKGEAFAAALDGKEWGRIDLTAAGAAGANQLSQDPTQYVEWLRGAGGDVEEVGEEEIDGVTTTHYKADIPVDAIVDQAPDEASAEALRAGLEVFGDAESFPVDVWVDADDLPRRISLVLGGEGASLSSKVTVDLFDYGVEVDAQPPESYKDISALLG